MKKILIVAVIALTLSVIGLTKWLNNERAERKRLENNQEALLSDVELYKTEAGDWAASVMMLELSKSELEKHCEDLNSTINDLNLKVNRVQSAATTATKTDVDLKIPVKDSIVYRDRIDTIKCIQYIDPWIHLNGCIDNGMFTGSINSVDTIKQIVHRVPKKFLFIKYGTKGIKQEVVSKNPHTKIVFTEYIELKGSKSKK